MKSEWTIKLLSEIADLNPRESISKGVMAKKISMDMLQLHCRDVSAYEVRPFTGGTKFRNGDTIMARITPCLENGKIAKVNVLDKDEVGFGSTEYIVFRAKEGLSDPNFIYYLVCSPIVREPAIKSMVGSSGRQRVQTDVIKKLEVLVPSLDEQHKIAGILKALDDKIELNNKINKNLEEQAVLLFRSMFTQTDSFSDNQLIESDFGCIPSTYKVVKAGDLPLLITDYVANGSFASLKENVTLYQEKNYAYFIRNTDLKADSFGVFVDKHSYDFLAKSTLYGGEIIISNVGDVGSVFLCPILDRPMTLGNNMIMLRSQQPELQYFLYVWFKWSYGQGLIQGIKGGSAQPKFNKTDFRNLPIMLPPESVLHEYHTAVSPMFSMIANNKSENSRLIGIRDSILPKLMSGELDVSNVDL